MIYPTKIIYGSRLQAGRGFKPLELAQGCATYYEYSYSYCNSCACPSLRGEYTYNLYSYVRRTLTSTRIIRSTSTSKALRRPLSRGPYRTRSNYGYGSHQPGRPRTVVWPIRDTRRLPYCSSTCRTVVNLVTRDRTYSYSYV
eukprot:scaffold599371_cov33-Prasinocladus_malaysianus.AAC.1